MAFVAQTAAGTGSANSYNTLAETDTYHSDRNNTDWDAATSTEKEFALIMATDYLEQSYGNRFIGERLTASGLHFPVDDTDADVYDNNGFIISGVPPAVKAATSEAALLALTTDLLPNSAATTEATSVSQGVGPLSRTITYQNNSTIVPVYPRVSRILTPVLRLPTVVRN